MGLLNLLLKDPLTFALLVIPLLYSIIIHELAHGWVAYIMGDSTAKERGRLTLNPLKHLDPVGTIMLFIFGFGWARPVPVDLRNIGNTRMGIILVSSAGIIANMVFAFFAVLALRLLSVQPSEPTGLFLYYLAQINIMLASFNLIPIPPLDGSKIVMGFMPERAIRLFPPGALRVLHHHRPVVPWGLEPGHCFFPLDHPDPDRCLTLTDPRFSVKGKT
jgi:Zn-dependent protease